MKKSIENALVIARDMSEYSPGRPIWVIDRISMWARVVVCKGHLEELLSHGWKLVAEFENGERTR